MAVASSFAVIMALVLLNWWGVALLVMLFFFLWAASRYLSSRFGGLTGDNYGAIDEFAEVVVLILAFVVADLGGTSWLSSFL
jgi:adenosylcobinamide-GDP ribazoletransferase